jgi:hypothetical protein
MTLGELLTSIDDIPDGLIVYVPDGEEIDLSTPSILFDLDAAAKKSEGLRYLLEVELIKDVIQAWSDWRNGRLPDLNDKLKAVVHYAEHDAYLPRE